jgi:hypothetical protein
VKKIKSQYSVHQVLKLYQLFLVIRGLVSLQATKKTEKPLKIQTGEIVTVHEGV